MWRRECPSNSLDLAQYKETISTVCFKPTRNFYKAESLTGSTNLRRPPRPCTPDDAIDVSSRQDAMRNHDTRRGSERQCEAPVDARATPHGRTGCAHACYSRTLDRLGYQLAAVLSAVFSTPPFLIVTISGLPGRHTVMSTVRALGCARQTATGNFALRPWLPYSVSPHA